MFKKRMKKSTIALITGLVLMGSGVGVMAAGQYTFDGTLHEPVEEYVLATGHRSERTRPYLSVKLDYSTAPVAYTVIYAKDSQTGADATMQVLNLSNSDYSWHNMTYKNSYSNNSNVDINLIGMLNSGHLSYTIYGSWNPNGRG